MPITQCFYSKWDCLLPNEPSSPSLLHHHESDISVFKKLPIQEYKSAFGQLVKIPLSLILPQYMYGFKKISWHGTPHPKCCICLPTYAHQSIVWQNSHEKGTLGWAIIHPKIGQQRVYFSILQSWPIVLKTLLLLPFWALLLLLLIRRFSNYCYCYCYW